MSSKQPQKRANRSSELPSKEDLKKEIQVEAEDLKHLEGILRHIHLVQNNAQLLGKRLIENGYKDLGISLIAQSHLHDNTKFHGIEWDYLRVGNEKTKEFKLAMNQHVKTNSHHPEYHGGINKMPETDIAEMVVDWQSRSTEFGTDLRYWFRHKACHRYEISVNSKSYKKIKFFIDMLLEKPFS